MDILLITAIFLYILYILIYIVFGKDEAIELLLLGIFIEGLASLYLINEILEVIL